MVRLHGFLQVCRKIPTLGNDRADFFMGDAQDLFLAFVKKQSVLPGGLKNMFEFFGEIMAQDYFSDVMDEPRDEAFLFFLESDVLGNGLRSGAAADRMRPEFFHAEFGFLVFSV